MSFWKSITWQAWKRPIEIPSIYKEYNLSQKSLATLRRKPSPASPLSMLLQWCRLFFRYFFEPAKQHWAGGMGEKEATVQCYCLRLWLPGEFTDICNCSRDFIQIRGILMSMRTIKWVSDVFKAYATKIYPESSVTHTTALAFTCKSLLLHIVNLFSAATMAWCNDHSLHLQPLEKGLKVKKSKDSQIVLYVSRSTWVLKSPIENNETTPTAWHPSLWALYNLDVYKR